MRRCNSRNMRATGWLASITVEIVRFHHGIEGLDQAALVAHETLVHVRAEAQVHAALPVVERAAAQHHARYQRLHAGAQIVRGVRREGEPGHLFDPPAVFAAGDGARHDRVDVPVDKHHEARAQRRNNLVLQPVREVGGVKERHGDRAEGVAFLGHLDALARQRRARHAGVEHGVSFLLQPLAQEGDLRAAPHRVRAFDHDQLALKLRGVHPRERFAIKLERLSLGH